MDRTIRTHYLAILIGVLAASVLVWQTSGAAFTDTTDNTGNSFEAGTVVLTDGDSGTALFTVSNWKPTDSSTNCIEVSYTGSITPAAAVTFYAASTDTGTNGGNGLSDDLDVTVTLGAASSTCSAFSAASTLYSAVTLGSLPSSASPGTTGWTPVVGSDTMRPFQITVTLGDDTANDAQGDSSTAAFTWAVTS